MKRVFLIVLDSFGIGEMPDAAAYGDEGSNTLASVSKSDLFKVPTLASMGLFNIDGVEVVERLSTVRGSYGKMAEKSRGKDTTTGHWEMAGIISQSPMPTYSDGFPQEIIEELEKAVGRKVLCNKPYSGTKVIEDYGRQHIESGDLIVYTSADSVMQIAAHEEVIPPEELYKICKVARKIMKGEHAVGRIIARPFVGEYPNFVRTSNRHDFSVQPPSKTMLDYLSENNFDTLAVGKIFDIFAGKGISQSITTLNNSDGMDKAMNMLETDFCGLCFVNLVDFDMLYGHRNDIDGYAKALSETDERLADFIANMRKEDLLIVTADHGCDPGTASTDHSREYVPLLIYGENIEKNVNLGTRESFSDISSTILQIFRICDDLPGTSFWDEIRKR
ncbi:MAG TPA: phosphopentomutase [Clostridiales bacterium]|nr:phosphopentomutase [Clostridiales bacterium]